MTTDRSHEDVEVNGKNYRCEIWYEDGFWYGKTFTGNYPTTLSALTRVSLLLALKHQIHMDINKAYEG